MGYVLNGSNQAIDLATLSSTGTAYSFGIWVKYSGTATNKFFFTSNAGGTNQNVLGYDNGQAKVEFAFWNGSTTTKIQATTAYNDGGWHLWICTKNGAEGAIYTDGSANGSAGSGLHSQAVVGGLDSIGYQRQSNVQYLNGTVGECFFIDRSISADEAKAIYDLMNKDYLLPFA